MKNWPSLLGLTTNDGQRLVVGHPSPATHLLLDRSIDSCACNLVKVRSRAMKVDATKENGAILKQALAGLMNAKRKAAGLPPFDRGTPCCQHIDDGANGPTLYMYEGGFRASLFPTWFWRLRRFHSGSPGHVRPLWEVLCLEMSSKNIIGTLDARFPATIEESINGK